MAKRSTGLVLRTAYSVRKAEGRQYLTQLNEYGVPLDSRESYTKLD